LRGVRGDFTFSLSLLIGRRGQLLVAHFALAREESRAFFLSHLSLPPSCDSAILTASERESLFLPRARVFLISYLFIRSFCFSSEMVFFLCGLLLFFAPSLFSSTSDIRKHRPPRPYLPPLAPEAPLLAAHSHLFLFYRLTS